MHLSPGDRPVLHAARHDEQFARSERDLARAQLHALALAAARELGVELPLTQALESRWRGAISRGHGEEDLAAIITEANRRQG